MAARKSELPLRTHALQLVDGDFDAMRTLFPNMPPTVAIRLLIHNYIKKVRAATAPVDLEIPTDQIKDIIQ
jgi:hypothetical protein